MSSLGAEASEAVNTFIDSLKDIKGKKFVTINQFDNIFETICSEAAPTKAPKLKYGKNYNPRGTTALYDAIGRTINSFGKKKNVIVCIVTDGMENASSDYTYQTIKDLIEEKKSSGWRFEFLSSDLQAFNIGQSFGMNTMLYDANVSGYDTVSSTMTRAVSDYMSSGNSS